MPWLAPDDVLPKAIETLVGAGTGNARICLVRDARGRIRIAVEASAVADPEALTKTLEGALGAWFAGPLVYQKGSPAHRRIATELFRDLPPWPDDWPKDYERLDGSRAPIPEWLKGRVVLNSKESWFARGSPPPSKPRVVSFFSFKGGVGRTTTLACVAARLANRGQKVVVIDLDLEAPGLGGFLGARSTTGVLDHVLSHLATGAIGDVNPEPVDGFPGLWVVPAAASGIGYLEKLARLDFLAGTSASEKSPTEQALRALIDAVAERVTPDLVLLDSRAGLHDIGGLALHRLSQMDVLVARANAQSREGLRIVLDAIRRLRAVEDRDVRLVQTMVKAPFDAPETKPLVERWRQDMYDIAIETIYADFGDDPELEVPELDHKTAHYPLLVAERDELTRADRLHQVSVELLPSFDEIANVVMPTLDAESED
ncbi:KGGVGR-motif variant AAA ATPase [Archangium sp.]|uniref:ParA family protein n=1 Tax=Archangium sp. TaxID=1872627 RepID=UPI00286C2F91|nr:AAA family ATPase [Archangium sp.]